MAFDPDECSRDIAISDRRCCISGEQRATPRSSSYVPVESQSQELMLCAIQPTAGEAGSLQPAHQIGHFAGSLPDDPGLVIGDHAQDRPLVNAEIITINPAYAPIDSASFKADMGITEAGAE